jgi:hypothetical protein
MNELIQKVAKMRELQTRYFKERDPLTLRAAKQAEREVDALIAGYGLDPQHRVISHSDATQPSLFTAR